MKSNSSIRSLVLIWLGWAVVMLAFQHWIGTRLELKPPDKALPWTADETTPHSQDGKLTLIEPFMNEHVAWDSKYYLSIAIAGYDGPNVVGIPSDFAWDESAQQFCFPAQGTDCTSLNYAFFPLYSWLTWVMTLPLRLFPLTAIARATLAAVIVSSLFFSRKLLSIDSSLEAWGGALQTLADK
jgi:hypothetical protein